MQRVSLQVHQVIAIVMREIFAELVVTETQGAVRLIGINRANKRNCVNHATALQLIDAFEQFEKDDSVKVGILHGKGTRAICNVFLLTIIQISYSLLLFSLINCDYYSFGWHF